jgi:hypothetical protein
MAGDRDSRGGRASALLSARGSLGALRGSRMGLVVDCGRGRSAFGDDGLDCGRGRDSVCGDRVAFDGARADSSAARMNYGLERASFADERLA